MAAESEILVLGLGNLLWADEGFGVRAVEALQRRYAFPNHVSVLDGGTQGLNLVGPVCEADILVVVDAVDFGGVPGAFHTARDGDVPQFLGAKKMSLHQTGFQEVLATADLLNQLPSAQYLVGVQPEVLEDYGGSLTATVADCIDPAIAAVLGYLRECRVQPSVRDRQPADAAGLPPEALDRRTYEAERPGPEEACRFADARFLRL